MAQGGRKVDRKARHDVRRDKTAQGCTWAGGMPSAMLHMAEHAGCFTEGEVEPWRGAGWWRSGARR